MVNGKIKGAFGFLVTLALLIVMAAPAFAASVDVTATPDSLVSPGSVDVDITVRNNGDAPLLEATVIGGGGEHQIGDIYPGGDASTAVRGYQVGQSELDDGFSWDLQWWTEDGELKSQSFSIPVAKKRGKPDISLSVKADKEQYRSGEEATLTYRVTNTGDLPLANIVITDGIASAPIAQGISLAPGDSESKTHTLTVEKSLESAGAVIGSAEDGQEVSDKADSLTLEVPETGLNLLLSEVESGAGVTSVDILLVNNGTVDFEKILLTDDTGAVIADGLVLKEGEEAHIDYEVPTDGVRQLTVNASYKAVGMEDALTAVSAPLELAPLYLPENIAITALVRADKTELDEAGPISLQLTLQNDNPIDLENVVLKEELGGTLLSIPLLPQGSSEHTATINVLESRDLNMYIEYEDTEGRPYREDIPPVHIEVAAMETVPSPVPLPEVGDNNIEMLVLMGAFGVVLLAVVIAIVVLLVKRARLGKDDDDEEMLENWIPTAPRRAVPREAVRELPYDGSPRADERSAGNKRPAKGDVQPRVLHGKRNENDGETGRGTAGQLEAGYEPVQREVDELASRQIHKTNQRPDSAAAERARRESAQAEQRAQMETDKRGKLSSTPPVRPIPQQKRDEQDGTSIAARRLAERKDKAPEQPKRQSAKQAPQDGRMARKQQNTAKRSGESGNTDGGRGELRSRPPESQPSREPSYKQSYEASYGESYEPGYEPDYGMKCENDFAGDGLPKVPNYIIEEERPRTIPGGAVWVPKESEIVDRPRRARPVAEQLSDDVEPLQRTESEDWSMFEEAFSADEEKPAREIDDWTLFEESFLDDDPKRP